MSHIHGITQPKNLSQLLIFMESLNMKRFVRLTAKPLFTDSLNMNCHGISQHDIQLPSRNLST